MPLPRQLFDLGVSPECELTMRLAYQFLAENRKFAYSLEEIEGELGELEGLEEALWALVRIRALERQQISGTNYFALLQEFDTGAWLSKKHLANQGG
jgi:hypothetical protein